MLTNLRSPSHEANILIYAADESDRSKFDTARDVVDGAVRGKGFMMSAQVPNEFASVMYRKFGKPDDEVDDLLPVLETVSTVPLNPTHSVETIVRDAWAFHKAHPDGLPT